MKKILFFFLLFSIFPLFSFAPGASAVMLSSERIAYVDIERVFAEYRVTKQAKMKMEKEIETRKSQIVKLEKEIRDWEASGKETEKVEPVTTTGLTGEEGVAISTVPAITGPAPEEVIRLKKEKLNQTKEELQKELTKLEKEMTHQILGRIYDIIREIARAEGYAIILDKKNILYSEMENDLTEKVIKRLNLEE